MEMSEGIVVNVCGVSIKKDPSELDQKNCTFKLSSTFRRTMPQWQNAKFIFLETDSL